jgi:hypothetical protein
MDLLCHAFKAEQRGVFRSNGQKWGSKEVAKLCGITESEAEAALKQLVSTGTAEKDIEGVIYCRRMVREEKQRLSKREAGRKGGKRSRPPSKREVKGGSPTPTPTPAPLQLATGVLESIALGLAPFTLDNPYKAATKIVKDVGGNGEMATEVVRRLVEWNAKGSLDNFWAAVRWVIGQVKEDEEAGGFSPPPKPTSLFDLKWPGRHDAGDARNWLDGAQRTWQDVIYLKRLLEKLPGDEYEETRTELTRRIKEVITRCHKDQDSNI